jgi:hypothetical protein
MAMDMLRTLGTNVEVYWWMRVMEPSKEAEIREETHWSDRSVVLPFNPKMVFRYAIFYTDLGLRDFGYDKKSA